jgi:hypothetical protein
MIALTLAAPATLPAQVTVRSGKEPSSNPNAVESPMIIDAPVDLAALAKNGQPVTVSNLGDYSCEGVHLELVIFASKKPTTRNDLVVTAQLWVDKGHDKIVDISLSLLRGDAVIASTRLLDIDAEEKSRASKSARMLIPPADFSDLNGLTLHVEMAVEKN